MKSRSKTGVVWYTYEAPVHGFIGPLQPGKYRFVTMSTWMQRATRIMTHTYFVRDPATRSSTYSTKFLVNLRDYGHPGWWIIKDFLQGAGVLDCPRIAGPFDKLKAAKAAMRLIDGI
jgi:hypothetical protein